MVRALRHDLDVLSKGEVDGAVPVAALADHLRASRDDIATAAVGDPTRFALHSVGNDMYIRCIGGHSHEVMQHAGDSALVRQRRQLKERRGRDSRYQ